jgi:3-dehydroquinate dehydratase-1
VCSSDLDKFFRIPENYRLQLYKDILPFVDFVDVEIRSRIAPLLIKEAKKKNKKIIASYHNFQTTPSEDILAHLCNQAKNLKADMVKIAVIAKEEKSLFRLITIINKQKKNIPMIVIPMGSNLLQRLVPLAFGCQFTYAAFNKKTGPGQPEIREII